MADAPEDPKTDNTQQARTNQLDKGKVVHTAFGEKMSGGVADVSDGDDVRRGVKAGAPADNGEPQQAKPKQVDKGKVVTTAFGEPMSGGVADISDGDDA
jgi:hypothetical protein